MIHLNITKTGADVDTLRQLESRIQAEFKNGLPPHLQPEANNMDYAPGSDQSRIFVASHTEFASLDPSCVQRILRERLILVHGNPLDYDYRWDLRSLGRVFDVDKRTHIQGEIFPHSFKLIMSKLRPVSTMFHPCEPQLRHHQGTLRELHGLTNNLPEDHCPPMNAISLPVFKRNLHIPTQFGSLASHEVAQSRIPVGYDRIFSVPDVRPQIEWSLVGSRSTISPLHADSDGLGTAVAILEGSKYWVVVSRFGQDDMICSVDSLGPSWDPYMINDGEKAKRLRFEGVHLQKGDML